MMPVTTVTMYRCDDGSTHAREEDAQRHQNHLDWFSQIKGLRSQGRQYAAAHLLYVGLREGAILVNLSQDNPRVPPGARGVAMAKEGGRISVAWIGYDQSWEDPETLAPVMRR